MTQRFDIAFGKVTYERGAPKNARARRISCNQRGEREMDANAIPDVPKSKRAPIVVWEAAAVVFYSPRDRGWFVRRYHSTFAMKAHLKGDPPPKHWGKQQSLVAKRLRRMLGVREVDELGEAVEGGDWRSAYGETGVFTKKEALEDVLYF